MEDLFKKFLDNQCSTEEVKKLLSFFSNSENEVLLRKLINESIAHGEHDHISGRVTDHSENIFNQIKKQLESQTINRQVWFPSRNLSGLSQFLRFKRS